MQEIWKVYREASINSYHNNRKSKIEVSNLGRVKRDGELEDLSKLKSGYYSVGGVNVHRMVAELFIPNIDNKPFVDHINTNTHDNSVENLRWVTHKENMNNVISYNKHLGRKLTDETKKKISEKRKAFLKEHEHPRGMTGKIPWNKGIKIKT